MSTPRRERPELGPSAIRAVDMLTAYLLQHGTVRDDIRTLALTLRQACGLTTAVAAAAPRRQPRSLRELETHPDVTSISDERGVGDGVWVYLRRGVICVRTGCRTIHEDTIREALAAFAERKTEKV